MSSRFRKLSLVVLGAAFLNACSGDDRPASGTNDGGTQLASGGKSGTGGVTSAGGGKTSASGGSSAGGGKTAAGGGSTVDASTSSGCSTADASSSDGSKADGATSSGGADSGPTASSFGSGTWDDGQTQTVLTGSWTHDGSEIESTGLQSQPTDVCPFDQAGTDTVVVTWSTSSKMLEIKASSGGTFLDFSVSDPKGSSPVVKLECFGCTTKAGNISDRECDPGLDTKNVKLESFDDTTHSLKLTYDLSGSVPQIFGDPSTVKVSGFIEVKGK